MDAYVSDIVGQLTVSHERLAFIARQFDRELSLGLSRDGQMLKALPTFVDALPTGTETGKFLTVDLGGTNLRVGLVQLLGDGKYVINKTSTAVPDEVKLGGGRDIFSFIATHVEAFLHQPHIETQLPLHLGFTFSFAVQQMSLAHGRIIGWSKEIVGEDVIGEDAVQLLQEALHARGLEIVVRALVNDTVGTLLAQLYADQHTRISVILGTGSNAAYIERSSKVAKLSRGASADTCTVINTEWGTFGDGTNYLPITPIDRLLDGASKNPGRHQFEKMLSGMYLGELFRLALKDAADRGFITWKCPAPYSLKTKHMSQFHACFDAGDLAGCRDILQSRLHIQMPPDDESLCRAVAQLCRAISLRSVELCAAGIASIYRRLRDDDMLPPSGSCTVAVDGALYQRYPGYSDILQRTVCSMLKDEDAQMCRVLLVMADDLSSVGAAAAIAAVNNAQQ